MRCNKASHSHPPTHGMKLPTKPSLALTLEDELTRRKQTPPYNNILSLQNNQNSVKTGLYIRRNTFVETWITPGVGNKEMKRREKGPSPPHVVNPTSLGCNKPPTHNILSPPHALPFVHCCLYTESKVSVIKISSVKQPRYTRVGKEEEGWCWRGWG